MPCTEVHWQISLPLEGQVQGKMLLPLGQGLQFFGQPALGVSEDPSKSRPDNAKQEGSWKEGMEGQRGMNCY